MIRPPRTAAALAAAALAGVSVWVFAQASDLLIWAAFIGWASYDSNGGGRDAAVVSSASLLFGVLVAWIVAVSVADDWLPFSSDLSSALAAAVASFFIVLASRAHVLSAVPSTFLGFASTFAYLSLADGADQTEKLTSFAWDNAGIAVAVSLVLGTGLGILHGELARLLSAPPAKQTAAKPRVRLDGSPTGVNQDDATATNLSKEA